MAPYRSLTSGLQCASQEMQIGIIISCNIHPENVCLQEDVAIMQWIDGRMILSCGAVVSPLGWSASRKLGLDLQGIHQPVPHFNQGPALKFISNIFHKGLKPGVPLARANWFIMDTSEHSLVCQLAHDVLTRYAHLSSPTDLLTGSMQTCAGYLLVHSSPMFIVSASGNVG